MKRRIMAIRQEEKRRVQTFGRRRRHRYKRGKLIKGGGATKEVFALAAKRQRNRAKRRREENFRGSGRKEDTEGDFLSGTHNLFSLLFLLFACGRRGEFGRVLLCLLTKLNEKFCAVALSPLPHSRHANRKKFASCTNHHGRRRLRFLHFRPSDSFFPPSGV